MAAPLFHIAQPQDWSAALSTAVYRTASLDVDGFIHCATRAQVVGVAARYYRAMTRLVLLELDPDRAEAPFVWEDTTGRGERFPHLYGPLPVAAVRSATFISVDAAGTITGWSAP
jgi:uncharacterized protein (DUF952 family)